MLASKVPIILSLSLTMMVSACFPPYKPVSESQLEANGIHFSKVNVKGKLASHKLFVAESGDSSDQMVLFIHGTPGSWQGYNYYLQAAELTSRAHLVALDRPGFGQSADGNWLPSFKDQASLLIQLRNLNHSGRPMILVGHSLGGSIAYRMAGYFPDLVSSLVVISSSIDPNLGKARWYNRLADSGFIKWTVPGELAKANREIMPLYDELLAMQPLLPGIRKQVSIIHGVKDGLVNFENLEYAENNLIHARLNSVPVEDLGHFILWERPEIVIQEIVSLLD